MPKKSIVFAQVNGQMTHEAVPVVRTIPIKFSELAGGEIIVKLDMAVSNVAALLLNLDDYPVGSKFGINCDVTLELHDDEKSVFIHSDVSVKLPKQRAIATRCFIDDRGRLTVPVLPGNANGVDVGVDKGAE